MRLEELAAALGVRESSGDLSVDVVTTTNDSRLVTPGSLFCCVRGRRVDGHDLARAAVDAGAVALLCERVLDVAVPQLVVADVRAAMGPAAAAVHGHPSRRLTVVGVTGTSGKSTTADLVRAILVADGRRTRVIGNLADADLGMSGDRPPTTPEAPQLQAELADAVTAGVEAIAIEVTSVASDQCRLDGTWFAALVFTNLGHDHLDYHGDLESYFRAKARLFDPAHAALAVVNRDDAHGRRLIEGARLPTVAYSMADADDVRVEAVGTSFRWRGAPVELALTGEHNVSNALAAATAAAELGIPVATIVEGIRSVRPPAGRYERVDEGQPFEVIVDFAHTPEALEKVLRAARDISGRPPVVVFGCGGDRDPTKRPLMGAVAAELARLVVLTSDNPRSEDPLAIIEDIRAGMAPGSTVVVEPDRAKAIGVGLAGAESGDVVVIAGKGHETGQTARGTTVPFDDRVVARELLREVVAG